MLRIIRCLAEGYCLAAAAAYCMPHMGLTACIAKGCLCAAQQSSSPLHPLQGPLHPCSGLYPLQHCTPMHGPHALQQGSSSLAVRFDRRCRSAQPCLLATSFPWKQCKSMPPDIYAPGAASRPPAHPAPQHSSNGPTCGNSPCSSVCSAACPPPRTSPRWLPPGTPSALRSSCLWGLGLHTWGGRLVQPDHRLMLEVILCLIAVLEVHCVVLGGCVEGHYGSQVPFLHAGPQHANAHVHNLQCRQVWDHPPCVGDAGHCLGMCCRSVHVRQLQTILLDWAGECWLMCAAWAPRHCMKCMSLGRSQCSRAPTDGGPLLDTPPDI